MSCLDEVLDQIYSFSFKSTKTTIHESTKEFKHLQLLLTNLIINQESNSTIIIGPPASGKNAFIAAALHAVTSSHQNCQHPEVIKVSGFLCKDLKSAITSLSTSLKLQTEIGDVIGDGNNFEDRMTDVLQYLCNYLAIKFNSKPLVIVLDRVDLFADLHTQGLLYNLLDVVQKKEFPLLVIGVTCRVDILELLEKRVKSRFSHRCLHIKSPTFPEYLAFTKDLLTLTNHSHSERSIIWNASVANLLSSTSVQQDLGRLYSFDKRVGGLVHFLTNVLILSKGKELNGELFRAILNQSLRSSYTDQVLDLSETQLLVILGTYRAIQEGRPAFNFPTLLNIISKTGSPTKKEDLIQAFESLIKLELVTPVDHRRGGNDKYYKSEIRREEFLQILKSYPNLPTHFQNLI